VVDVVPGSGAAKVGLRATRRARGGRLELGDTIVAADARPVKVPDDLYDAIESHQPGERLALTVVRDGRRLELSVTLGAAE